ncbi:MAG: transcriptional repressor LexA [Xanthomonadaceae bacterium]|nr:transcriptional repressor LexA [Xanthomonadaceae bacterium]
MKNILTRRQQEILDYLREQDFDPPPTLDELCRALGLSSRGSLHKHISALVEAGLVEPMDGKHRGVLLRDTEAAADEERLPFLGYIAAGRPIEAIPQPETLAVPAALRTHRPCYVLEVRGDSMIEDGILDGDWVVIEQRDQARNGEVVVALVDGGEATLKRIEQKPGQVILHPANGRLAPLRYTPEQVQVQGILVGQMRRYH